MEASFRREGDITIVTLKGFLDFETSEPFSRICQTKLMGQKVIFDFYGLSFVGSSGMTPFLYVVRDFVKMNSMPTKFSGLSQEFRRLFFANQLSDFEIYENVSLAFTSYYQPVQQIQKFYYTESYQAFSPTEVSDTQIDPEYLEVAEDADPN